jgi:hypothetical protein
MKNDNDYLVGHEASGLKIGDIVRITRVAEDYEAGWDLVWPSNDASDVGRIGKIDRDDNYIGFRVFFEDEDCGYYFPYFVLEKMDVKPRFFVDKDRVYSLKQDGWRNGEPNMVNDDEISFQGPNKEDLAQKVCDLLNQIHFRGEL